MPDLFSETATEDLPREPLVGLRRRHQAGFIFRHHHGEEEEIDIPVRRGAEVDIENRNRNDAQNMGWNAPPQQDTGVYDNDEEETTRDGADINHRRTRTPGHEPSTPNRLSSLSGSIGIGMFRISRLYCFLSILLAMIAIVLSPIPIHKMQFHNVATIPIDVREGDNVKSRKIEKIGGRRDVKKKTNNRDSIASEPILWSVEEFITRAAFLGSQENRKQDQTTSMFEKLSFTSRQNSENTNRNDNESSDLVSQSNYWIQRTSSLLEETAAEILNRIKGKEEMPVEHKSRWRASRQNENTTGNVSQCNRNSDDSSCKRKGNGKKGSRKHNKEAINENWQWIDPIFFEHGSFSNILTHVIDKILTSTVRLCIITNLFLTITYLLHSAVAVWFLSNSGAYNNASEIQQQRATEGGIGIGSEWSLAPASGVTAARERMGGFLIFKLLLISAVLTPDALDLMILVTWFTLLGCLRSLDHLAHSTNIHLNAVGQPPKKGIVQLLVWVLFCDMLATGSCVALFHTAGYGMVLLLTCDCALLGTDVVSHILKYYQTVWENSHDNDIRRLEEQQLNLSRANENESHYASTEDRSETRVFPTTMNAAELRQESDSLALQMEDLELAHTRRLSALDTAIFTLDMTCHILTVGHFCHIWALHGVQFTLIDGVLALHLHSAISAACTKLIRRRNIHKIARDLEGQFPNATEEELRQAANDDDVCCICLGSMSKGSNVKKAKCGHMYHTNCLGEVIARAQSVELAKCPLCRAPLVGDCHLTTGPSLDDNNNFIRQNNTAVGPRAADRVFDAQVEGESDDHAIPVNQIEEEPLFRFSTEGILPAWVPMPALSFEIVRRPPIAAQRALQTQNLEFQMATDVPTQRIAPVDIGSVNQEDDNQGMPVENPQDPEQDAQIPFFQRILLFTGLMPMSPEEEARALAQLVDMFPQYDRNDLARELQRRGSMEAVTEAILIGIVPGVPRFFE